MCDGIKSICKFVTEDGITKLVKAPRACSSWFTKSCETRQRATRGHSHDKGSGSFAASLVFIVVDPFDHCIILRIIEDGRPRI